MSSIKVIHSTHRWLPQTQTWLYNQIKYLPGRIESHIVCQETLNLDQFSLPNIHSLHASSRWAYYWQRAIRWLGIRQHLSLLTEQLQKQQGQLLHSHFGNLGWANLAAARQANVRHVVTFYGRDVNHLPQQDSRWYGRYQELFSQVDCVLCEGPFMGQCVIRLGCPAGKVQVHHLGVPVEQFPFRPRFWNGQEPLRVLIAASFQEKKGIPYAIEALGKVQREIPLEVTLIGDADGSSRSQQEKQRILDAIERAGLSASIQRLGYQPYARLMEEAYRHHLFLAPSVTAGDGDTEGGAPVGIIEMLATGMMVVSTTHCDIPEVIEHGVTGLLAAERDADGLAEQIRWLAAHPGEWQPMAMRARQRMETDFNAAVQGQRLADLYEKVLC